MDPHIRRIIAVEAHRRRTGKCPTMIHALGTGESFDIAPDFDGFTDLESGMRARIDGNRVLLPDATIDILMGEDVGFTAVLASETISGRSGGGSSVTIYDREEYFQYAVVNEHGI